MKHIWLFLTCALFYFQSTFSYAQVSGVINNYASVAALDYSLQEVTVASTVGFSVGDKVLLIQMNGATIDQTNSVNYGDVTAVGAAGNYEFQEICSISGSKIGFTKNLVNAYDPALGAVQLVTVPQYTNETVSGTLNCTAWNGITGGVVVLEASGTLTLY